MESLSPSNFIVKYLSPVDCCTPVFSLNDRFTYFFYSHLYLLVVVLCAAHLSCLLFSVSPESNLIFFLCPSSVSSSLFQHGLFHHQCAHISAEQQFSTEFRRIQQHYSHGLLPAPFCRLRLQLTPVGIPATKALWAFYSQDFE